MNTSIKIRSIGSLAARSIVFDGRHRFGAGANDERRGNLLSQRHGAPEVR